MLKSNIQYIFILSLTLIAASGFVFEKKGIVWSKKEFDFGTIKQGDLTKTSFTCYNYSDSILIFENVMPSCGCVAPLWQKTPINPGDSSILSVEFDSKGKSKQHSKTIAVYTNQGLFELFIKANIIKQ
jgi:hypothetical protein